MLSTYFVAALQLIQGLLPAASSGALGVVDSIIGYLVKVVPLVISEVPAMVAEFQSVITSLSATGGLTADQVTQLQALSAQCDADFEAAAAAAGAGPDTTNSSMQAPAASTPAASTPASGTGSN